MKKIMTKAVQLAKKMEGDWQARMKMALKMAWAIAKKTVKITIGRDLKVLATEIKEAFAEEMIFVTANVWEKYGKRRIYVNRQGDNAGYFEFDKQGHFVKSWNNRIDWDFGKTSSQFNAIKFLLENNYNL